MGVLVQTVLPEPWDGDADAQAVERAEALLASSSLVGGLKVKVHVLSALVGVFATLALVLAGFLGRSFYLRRKRNKCESPCIQ